MVDSHKRVLLNESKNIHREYHTLIEEQINLTNQFFLVNQKPYSMTSIVWFLNEWLLWAGSF